MKIDKNLIPIIRQSGDFYKKGDIFAIILGKTYPVAWIMPLNDQKDMYELIVWNNDKDYGSSTLKTYSYLNQNRITIPWDRVPKVEELGEEIVIYRQEDSIII